MTLSLTTQIPTFARGQVRALVKAHPDWHAFLEAQGLVSAQAKNRDLLNFALRYPDLVAKIEAILGAADLGTQDNPSCDVEPADVMDEAADDIAAPLAIDAGFTVDGVLSSVEQFLGSSVRAELAKSIQPVIDAANKPAETIEVERIVEVEPGQAPRVITPKAKRGKKVTFRTLYPSRAKDLWRDAELTLWSGADCPDVDPFYVTDHERMSALMIAIEAGIYSWLAGPSGSGKTTLPYQAAAMLGRPIVKIEMTRQTEIEAMVGGLELVNGNTVWKDGVLTAAIRQPGMIILIDEITLAPAGVQAIFQHVCGETRSLTLPTGEIVRCADGVVFVAADNTTGSGDEGGLYAGTNISNAALVNRFPWMQIIDYMSEEKEAAALANHTACPIDAAKKLAAWVAQCRRQPTLAGVVISLRQMIGFIKAIQRGFSAKQAFAMALSSRMPATERAVIDGMIDLAWSQSFEALVRGTSLPVAPTAPSNSAASQAFNDQAF